MAMGLSEIVPSGHSDLWEDKTPGISQLGCKNVMNQYYKVHPQAPVTRLFLSVDGRHRSIRKLETSTKRWGSNMSKTKERLIYYTYDEVNSTWSPWYSMKTLPPQMWREMADIISVAGWCGLTSYGTFMKARSTVIAKISFCYEARYDELDSFEGRSCFKYFDAL